MPYFPEAALIIEGTVVDSKIETASNGKEYLTVRISNDYGMSDVSFNVAKTQVYKDVAQGDVVKWLIRPFVKYGISSRTQQAYGILRLNFLDEAPENA